MRHGGPSGTGRRQARGRDINDLRQAASDPESGRTQQCIQMGHNFIPGAFTQAVGSEITGARWKVWVPLARESRSQQK
jgi:hypothetical protein